MAPCSAPRTLQSWSCSMAAPQLFIAHVTCDYLSWKSITVQSQSAGQWGVHWNISGWCSIWPPKSLSSSGSPSFLTPPPQNINLELAFPTPPHSPTSSLSCCPQNRSYLEFVLIRLPYGQVFQASHQLVSLLSWKDHLWKWKYLLKTIKFKDITESEKITERQRMLSHSHWSTLTLYIPGSEDHSGWKWFWEVSSATSCAKRGQLWAQSTRVCHY